MSFTVTDDLEPPRMTPAVRWLIAINVVVYFLEMTMIDRADIQGDILRAYGNAYDCTSCTAASCTSSSTCTRCGSSGGASSRRGTRGASRSTTCGAGLAPGSRT